MGKSQYKSPTQHKKTYKTRDSGINSNRINEIYSPSNKYLIFEDIDKIRKSICKIKSKEGFGTGFFIDYNSYKYLITCYHVISEEIKNIVIEIWDKHDINLNLNNRNIIYLPKPKDITIIQLKEKEINEIDYLFFDLDYVKGYKLYTNNEALSLGYPKGEKLASGSGLIKEIVDEYDFYHNIPTSWGSSGSPIIQFNTLLVIGIHKEAEIEEQLNVGIFAGEAIKEINKKIQFLRTSFAFNNLGVRNIKAIINKDNNVEINKNKFICDTNLYDKQKLNDINKIKKEKHLKKRNSSVELNIKYFENETKYKNKNEINCIYKVKENREIFLLHDFKENINYFRNEETKEFYNEAKKIINGENIYIFINNKKIEFNQKYKSNETGLIHVKFKFKKLLTSTAFMFFRCCSLKSIDLSSFKAHNITNMCGMFSDISSLESINLSSLNTINVKNMEAMFQNCLSLKSINLSSLITNNVTDMSCMFSGCSSLISLDLSSLNTNNVKNMCAIFQDCSSLKSINLSSINTILLQI